jgi:hypothetical protein
MLKKTAVLALSAGLATTASAQFTTILFNSFETAVRADQNEFALASVDSTTSQSLYPLNTSPLSPDPITDSNFDFVEFPAGTIFQPPAEFDGGDIDLRFDSPQTGLGIINANFGFELLEVNFVAVTSSDDPSVTGLPTTGDDRGSIVTQDSTLPVDSAFRSANGFGSSAALSGLNFVGGDTNAETNFELFFQDVNNFGNNGPVDFSTGPQGSPSAFFTGESTGDFIGAYPAWTLAGFLSDLELVNTTTVQVPVEEVTVTPLTDGNDNILVDTVVIDGVAVDFPQVTVTTDIVMVDQVQGDIRADANYDGTIGATENIGQQAYEFNDTDGSIILQFDPVMASNLTEGEVDEFRTLQLCFNWARNATGYEDENLNFFTNDIDGDGEDDLILDINGDGIADATGNQQPDSLKVFVNDTLIFEASAEARVQQIVDGATVRRLVLEYGLFDPESPNFGGVPIPATDFFGWPNNVPTDFPGLTFTPRLEEDPFGPAGTGEIGTFLPDNSPLPWIPSGVDVDGDGDFGGSDLNGDGIIGTFVNDTGAPLPPGPGNGDDSENPLDDDGNVPVGGVVVEQDPAETFSDQNTATWPQAFFDFVDAQDGNLDGEVSVAIGPISDARVLRNIDSNTAGGDVPVLEFENFYPEVINISDFIGEEIVLTVVGTTTAGTETLVFDHVLIRGSLNCNAADLVAPFGVLDLNDVTAFVDAFTTGGAAADLNLDGILDLTDVTLFVGAFNAGCP